MAPTTTLAVEVLQALTSSRPGVDVHDQGCTGRPRLRQHLRAHAEIRACGGDVVSLEIGIASLADFQPKTVDGTRRSPQQRLDDIVSYAMQADTGGLHHVGLGEHHSRHFVVSSPAVVLSAIAAQTTSVRLTSSVSVLSALDPVRLYQDFATLDLMSGGRAELTVGRSAYPEPFALFGADIRRYDDLFSENLDLLLRLRTQERVTWRGHTRPPLDDAQIVPRSVQDPLPVWVGVGGTPASAARAGRLGLPMILGYIGGPARRLRDLVDVYREAGESAGQTDSLRVGVALHFLAGGSHSAAAAAYPYYFDFMRPKDPGGGGFLVSREQYDAGRAEHGHLMIGPEEQIVDKLAALHDRIGFDRLQALVDWGGLPHTMVHESLARLSATIAPALRRHVGERPGPAQLEHATPAHDSGAAVQLGP